MFTIRNLKSMFHLSAPSQTWIFLQRQTLTWNKWTQNPIFQDSFLKKPDLDKDNEEKCHSTRWKLQIEYLKDLNFNAQSSLLIMAWLTNCTGTNGEEVFIYNSNTVKYWHEQATPWWYLQLLLLPTSICHLLSVMHRKRQKPNKNVP